MNIEASTSIESQAVIAADRMFLPGRMRELFRRFMLRHIRRFAGMVIEEDNCGCRIYMEIHTAMDLTRQICVGKAIDGDDFMVIAEAEIGRTTNHLLYEPVLLMMSRLEYPSFTVLLRDRVLCLRSARRALSIVDECEFYHLTIRLAETADRVDTMFRRGVEMARMKNE